MTSERNGNALRKNVAGRSLMLIARSSAVGSTALFTTILGTVDPLALKLGGDLLQRDRRECRCPVPGYRPLAEKRLSVPRSRKLANDPGGFRAVLLQRPIEGSALVDR